MVEPRDPQYLVTHSRKVLLPTCEHHSTGSGISSRSQRGIRLRDQGGCTTGIILGSVQRLIDLCQGGGGTSLSIALETEREPRPTKGQEEHQGDRQESGRNVNARS